MRRLPAVVTLLIALIATPTQNVAACGQPSTLELQVAFTLAANGELPVSYPGLTGPLVRSIPVSLLMSIAWVESGWRQYRDTGQPLVSPGFGYGLMQITSGMAGAYGNPIGSLAPTLQSRIATDYVYNIAYGAEMLAQKFEELPKIGGGDTTALEDWYYAIWAYNGWGWANNPNNPRFTRVGTPESHPDTFPYQERVLYWVAHPPDGGDGAPLWPAVTVSLPTRSAIGKHPGPLTAPAHPHRQSPLPLSASYGAAPAAGKTSSRLTLPVRVVNTGTATWAAGQLSIGYALTPGAVNPDALRAAKATMQAHGTAVVPIGMALAPGKGTTVRVTIRAPKAPGPYHILWDLHGKDGWLSARGALPGIESLTVTNSLPATATPAVTATVVPAEAMLYIADTSVPDGTQVAAGTILHKGWLVLNDGAAGWGTGWALHLVSGPALDARIIPVSPTKSCSTTTILATLRAPAKPGSYHSSWQLEDAGGMHVGAPLTVTIRVQSATPPKPTATPRATPTATPVG